MTAKKIAKPTKVTRLPVRLKTKPYHGVIRALETMLEAAKRGEIVAVAVSAQFQGQAIATDFAIGPNGDGPYLIAALETAKMRILDESMFVRARKVRR